MGQKFPTLHHSRILILEDEPFIALDLAQMVEEADGIPVGPAATVGQALRLIEDDGITAAILDVNLPDGDIGPVLAALQAKGAFVVVHTGARLPEAFRTRYPAIAVVSKPVSHPVLIGLLAAGLEA